MAETDGSGRRCGALEAEISALLDGELAAPEAAAAEAHLRSCPSCASAARDLAAVSRTLRTCDAGEPPVPVPAGFRARVLASAAPGSRLAGRLPAGEPSDPSMPSPSPFLRWLPALAAAASFLAVAGLGAALRSGEVSPGFSGEGAVETARAAPPTAQEFLARAEGHRAAGRADLERQSLLAALGLAPGDPGVREAFARAYGFDPSVLDRRAEEQGIPGAAASRVPGSGPEEGGGESPSLWIGPWKFASPGAYDGFLTFREKSRALEVAQAAREASRASESRTVASVREPPQRPDPLARTLASLRVGAPVGGNGSVQYPGIVVYPLRAAAGVPAAPGDVLSLPEALESRRAEVLDSAGRSAGTVLVSNLDPERSLLVLAGEVVRGGRADRMVARDVLVPAGSRNVPIPVYAVDVGRGSSRSYGTRFRSVAGVAGVRLRGLAVGQASAEDLAEFVRDRLNMLDVTASRRSLADAYNDRGPASLFLRAARPEAAALVQGLQDPDVVGFAVAQGRDLLCLEVFGSHRLLAAHAARLLEGSALEGRTFARGGARPALAEVSAMLEAAGRGAPFGGAAGSTSEVGLLALEGGLLGSGVVRGDALYHAVVFRGAGSGAILGRGARGGDLPGSGSAPSSDSSAEGGGTGTEPPPGGEGGGGPSSTAGGEGGSRPSEAAPTTERPR